ncbi:hypothetical protein H1D32_13350 [Anaerobacillus sp. CMMVII]|uniref:hypothetical protein n=1 Tax=Anaerobacillus sp. CMMVII TaxID=2755588 RepID=UPI0021B7EE66|nr:hypothetical protein [Anaerobacillus sp. CMMVII]MCT8138640.1 hypothetical protein [Anaerobacillus sp. CMMVII]
MPTYIDNEYYRSEYMGVEIDDNNQLLRYIKRASDIIDQVTNYKIKDFNELHPFIQEQVKKATAAQVEFFELEGGPEMATIGNTLNNVSLGKFSYGKGTVPSNNQNSNIISTTVINYLKPTGLLYSGVATVGAYHV